MTTQLLLGRCEDLIKQLEDNSIDSIVTDPPYGLSFFGKAWDYQVPSVEVWKQCLRVLKPGGHLLSFSSSRTYHRMVVNVEDAGFEIRDQLMWVYGSGFPKNHNLGDGKGTALKPAHEPIVLARKPIGEKTIKDNVLKWGTGGLNIDKSRVPTDEPITINTFDNGAKPFGDAVGEPYTSRQSEGRYPANFIHDGSQEVLDFFPEAGNGWKKNYGEENYKGKSYDSSTNQCAFGGKFSGDNTYCDSGSAARFFYCPKVSKKERNAGMPEPIGVFCERPKREDGSVIYKETHPEEWEAAMSKLPRKDSTAKAAAEEKLQGSTGGLSNNHPTVKPIKLMSYLVNLITPPGGTILDPFMGSGSTGCASVIDGYSFVGVEMDKDYLAIAESRIKHFARAVVTDHSND